jgi:uncharacterized protein
VAGAAASDVADPIAGRDAGRQPPVQVGLPAALALTRSGPPWDNAVAGLVEGQGSWEALDMTEPGIDPAKRAECWCCGNEYATEDLVRLGCHDEIGLCEACIGWLADRRPGAVRRTIPILATGDVSRAVAHYAALGFETEHWEGGGYGFVMRDGVELLHLGEREGLDPASNTVSCYLHVRDADALYAEWAAAGVDGELVAPFDTDYGLREGSHTDLDGNVVRFGSPITNAPGEDGEVLVPADDPLAMAATTATQSGDVDALRQILVDHPELAIAQIGSPDQARTLLHAATDWPGHFPNVSQTIGLLVDRGADVNARFVGSHAETPLHWAASSDDVEAATALLDAGADIDAPGAVLGGGPPLADAVGFGQWQVARLLVDRGAATRLKDAAALGLLDRLDGKLTADEPPSTDEITGALWSACHAGQREAAEHVLAHGADPNWVGWDGLTPLDVAAREGHDELAEFLEARGAKRAGDLFS